MSKFIAIYGGSYNPPTETHRAIGVQVRDQFKPDEVWYMVAAQNPHKNTAGMAPFADRIEMSKINILGEPKLVVTDIEKEIYEKIHSSQTADILKELMPRFPDTRFAWVMGADCFATLHTWGDFKYILEHVPIIVVPRKGWTEKAQNSIAAGIIDQTKTPDELRTAKGWHMLAFPEDDVSATHARGLINNGQRPHEVRPAVYNYTQQHPGLFL